MNQNKTFLQDLPQLDDIMSSAQRKTRQHHPPNAYEMYNSGQMRSDELPSKPPPQSEMEYNSPDYGPPPQPTNPQEFQTYSSGTPDEYFPQQPIQHLPYANQELSCAQIAAHVDNCVICRKFYDTDTSKHIMVIIALIILNIYLLRKVV